MTNTLVIKRATELPELAEQVFFPEQFLLIFTGQYYRLTWAGIFGHVVGGQLVRVGTRTTAVKIITITLLVTGDVLVAGAPFPHGIAPFATLRFRGLVLRPATR